MQTINSLETDIDKLDGEIAVFNEKGVIKKRNALKEENTSLEERLSAAEVFENTNENTFVITDELISDIVGLIPRDLYLRTMSISGNNIVMAGFAYDRAIVAEYEYALRASNRYEGMHVNVIQESEDEETSRYTFTIVYETKGVE